MVASSTLAGSQRRTLSSFIRLLFVVGAALLVRYRILLSPTISLGDKRTSVLLSQLYQNSKASANNEGTGNTVYTDEGNDTVALGNRHSDASHHHQQQQQQVAASSRNITSLPWPSGQVNDIADSHNRLVVFIVSCPYLEMLDNVVESMKLANVTNHVVVPLDNTTQDVASKLYPNHTVSIPPFVKAHSSNTAAARYGSSEFKELTASRPVILSAFLTLGYTVFYCDTDVVWKSNPLDILHNFSNNQDVVGMVDNHINAEVCSCYLYLKPTSRTFSLLNKWKELIQRGRFQHDQAAFYAAYQQLRNDTNMNMLPPDNSYFPSGHYYFRKFNANQKAHVVMIHNNFIIGYQEKKKRFIQQNLWHPSNAILSMEYTC